MTESRGVMTEIEGFHDGIWWVSWELKGSHDGTHDGVWESLMTESAGSHDGIWGGLMTEIDGY